MFPSRMACTEAVSVVLSWLRAAFGGRNQGTLATSQRAQLTSATQRPGQIVATEVLEYTSPPTLEVPDKGMSCSAPGDYDASSSKMAH
jgi:hypothetical protein